MQLTIDHFPPGAFYPDRLQAVAHAARCLARNVNRWPNLDGTTAAKELRALIEGDAPFDYLDDLEARVGIDVTDARALLALAYGATDAELPCHVWTLYCRGYYEETPR